MYCNVCGTENSDGAQFCTGCGARIGATKANINEKGFWQTLFDFSFSNYVTLMGVKTIYLLTVILLGVFGLLGIVGGFAWDPATGALYLILIPLALVLAAVYIRVSLELFVHLFRIAYDLREIKETLQSRTTEDVNGQGHSNE